MNYIDQGISGWMSAGELEWLFIQAQMMETIVEIGSWMGRSTHALLSGCREGTVIAVDHFKGSASEINGAHIAAKDQDIYALFKKNVGSFPNLVVFRMESVKAASFFKDLSIDMIFLDGDHEYPQVKDDFVAWHPKCKKLFCGHDFTQGGLPKTFEEMNLKPQSGFADSLWSLEL